MSALVSGAWRVWKRKRESIRILYGAYAIVAESVVKFSLVQFRTWLVERVRIGGLVAVGLVYFSLVAVGLVYFSVAV